MGFYHPYLIYHSGVPRRQPIFREAYNAFELPDDVFIKYFRVSKDITRYLCHELDDLEPLSGRRNVLSVEKQVLCALRFFACGSYQQNVANEFCLQISQPSTSKCIRRVSESINRKLLRKWVKFPRTDCDIQDLKMKFNNIAKFPGTVGAIDCTHVNITSPPKKDPITPEHIFINRHRTHSINVQVIYDPDLRILNCNARFPGSTHDSFIWRQSAAKRRMMQIQSQHSNTWLVGDSGYPLEPWMMVPKQDPAAGSPEERYNEAHAKARNVVERCIGVLKARFRCLLKERVLFYNPTVAAKIINACIVLHNICKANGMPDPEVDEDEDPESDSDELPSITTHYSEGQRIQTRLIYNYFSQ